LSPWIDPMNTFANLSGDSGLLEEFSRSEPTAAD
jgi:hypothetical protein